MSDSVEEIKVGDRFEVIDVQGSNLGVVGDVWVVTGRHPRGESIDWDARRERDGKDDWWSFGSKSLRGKLWRLLPPLSPPSPSKGPEVGATLTVGEPVRDVTLLQPGMRLRLNWRLRDCPTEDVTVTERVGGMTLTSAAGSNFSDTGSMVRDGHVIFLGWAPGHPAAATPAPPVVQRDAPKPFTCPSCMRTDPHQHLPTRIEKAAPLPFKRHPGCLFADRHNDKLCLNCERLIAKYTPWDPDDWDTQLPPLTSAPEPSRNGYGVIADTFTYRLPYNRRC